MIENTATYDFLIENENQSLNHSFQRKIRTTKIHGGAGSDVEEDLDALDARERKWTYPSEGGARREAEENLDRLIPQAGQSPKLD